MTSDAYFHPQNEQVDSQRYRLLYIFVCRLLMRKCCFVDLIRPSQESEAEGTGRRLDKEAAHFRGSAISRTNRHLEMTLQNRVHPENQGLNDYGRSFQVQVDGPFALHVIVKLVISIHRCIFLLHSMPMFSFTLSWPSPETQQIYHTTLWFLVGALL